MALDRSLSTHNSFWDYLDPPLESTSLPRRSDCILRCCSASAAGVGAGAGAGGSYFRVTRNALELRFKETDLPFYSLGFSTILASLNRAICFYALRPAVSRFEWELEFLSASMN